MHVIAGLCFALDAGRVLQRYSWTSEVTLIFQRHSQGMPSDLEVGASMSTHLQLISKSQDPRPSEGLDMVIHWSRSYLYKPLVWTAKSSHHTHYLTYYPINMGWFSSDSDEAQAYETVTVIHLQLRFTSGTNGFMI